MFNPSPGLVSLTSKASPTIIIYCGASFGAGIEKAAESPEPITKFSFIEIVGAKVLTNEKPPSPIIILPTTMPIRVRVANIIK
jgi:hypothetical protein